MSKTQGRIGALRRIPLPRPGAIAALVALHRLLKPAHGVEADENGGVWCHGSSMVNRIVQGKCLNPFQINGLRSEFFFNAVEDFLVNPVSKTAVNAIPVTEIFGQCSIQQNYRSCSLLDKRLWQFPCAVNGNQ